jgi:hypothetical protein
MSVLLMTRRAGGAAAAGGGIAAVLTQQGTPTTGALRFTGVFPLPPSGTYALDPADHRKFSVWIGGVEQAMHTEAAYGEHPTGKTLGIRYDLDYTAASTADVVCEVRIGTTRATTDPSRRTIGITQSDAARWLCATSASYLCTTNLTGMPLVPRTLWNATEEAFLGTLFDGVLAANADSDIGASRYDHGRAMASMYCCTGNPTYLKRAYAAAKQRQSYYLASGTDWTSSFVPGDLGSVKYETFNEPNSIYEYTMRVAYLTTGYSGWWGLVNHYGQAHSRTRSTLSEYNANVFKEGYGSAPVNYSGIRFNLRNLRWFTAAYLTGGTYAYANSSDGQPMRQAVFVDELPRALTALDTNKYSTSFGAYRENMRGQFNMNLAPSLGYTPTPTWQEGDFPLFWLSIICDWMLDVYHNITPDSRIPAWLKVNVDIALENHFALPSSHRDYTPVTPGQVRYGAPYLCYSTAFNLATDYVSANSGDQEELAAGRLLAPMLARTLAFLAVKYPSDTVNGATYATWRNRFINVEQAHPVGATSDWDYKVFGEIMQGLSIPYYRINGDPGGPATLREPTVYTSLPT